LIEWAMRTPDGRTLHVRREKGTWVAWCGKGDEVQNELLDIALIEAIRGDAAVLGHSRQPEYGAGVRAHADQIERDFRSISMRPDVARPADEV
jgi:hypothetical protein